MKAMMVKAKRAESSQYEGATHICTITATHRHTYVKVIIMKAMAKRAESSQYEGANLFSCGQ